MDRCSPQANAMIRTVAKQEGALVADLEKMFTDIAPHGIIDGSLLDDNVHWRSEYMGVFACGVVNALKTGNAPLPFLSKSPGKCPLEKLHSETGAQTKYKLYGYTMDFIKTFSSGKLDMDRRQDEIFERGISMLQRLYNEDAGLLSESLQSPQAAYNLLPPSMWFASDGLEQAWPHYLEHAGEFYRRIGKTEQAIDCFNRALQYAPDLYMARLYRALAYTDAGKTQKAREDFKAIYRYKEGHPEIGALAALEHMIPDGN
jgi:tetratricopeptide (TPR) repeat protein